MIVFAAFAAGLCLELQRLSAAQTHSNAAYVSSSTADEKNADDNEQVPPTPSKLNEMTDRIFKQEHVEIAAIELYAPTIETYIQEVKFNKVTGVVPKSDYYFLGQADFRGRLKVHSMTGNSKKGSLMWSFEPAGFLQMIYIDRGQFDKAHYKLNYPKREFLGEVRCIRFEVSPTPNARGPRFVGEIWVEDQDYTVVRISGTYAPAVRFSLKTFEDEYYLHFDSWRTNVKSGLWLPSYVYSQELHRPTLFGNPSYKSSTHLWGYKLKPGSREEELSRLLVESTSPIRDEATQHDRSPLEAQREWRHGAEKNVLELLEKIGLIAPQGEVDKLLNTVVNNLEVTNNFDQQIDLRCRVLLTNTLEMFSIGNTLVLSRGLIDVVPNEETLAALIAHAMADAMLPKPNQDQYGFSDILRLSPTEVLRRLSFEEGKIESAQNNEKAMELLKKSPYASNLGNAGLFLKQLHSQAKTLKQLISPQLGNEIFSRRNCSKRRPRWRPTTRARSPRCPWARDSKSIRGMRASV